MHNYTCGWLTVRLFLLAALLSWLISFAYLLAIERCFGFQTKTEKKKTSNKTQTKEALAFILNKKIFLLLFLYFYIFQLVSLLCCNSLWPKQQIPQLAMRFSIANVKHLLLLLLFAITLAFTSHFNVLQRNKCSH